MKSSAINLPWLGTFHAICVENFKKHANAASLSHNFSIIDNDDQTRLIKNICKSENIDIKKISPNFIIGLINKWKNNGWYPENVKLNRGQILEKNLLKIYQIYQSKLLDLNACDFGDLILHCVSIFEKNSDICEIYSKKFKFILVDEYQDTNFIQSKWLGLLAKRIKIFVALVTMINQFIVGGEQRLKFFKFR